MSTSSGLSSKGEKKKYSSLNINNLYQGKSIEQHKTTGINRQHGSMLVLGKVGSTRRLPPPANLPSLRSENSGNDPKVRLVPTGGSGWGSSSKEKSSDNGGQQPSSQPSLATATSSGQQVQTNVDQPKTATVGGSSSSSQSSHAPVNTSTSHSSTAGGKSWSSVTSGDKKAGGFIGSQSPYFQDEFPSLAPADEKSQDGKKDERDSQYGPGPSLRPQNVASWREGGGRGASAQPPSPQSPVPSSPSAGEDSLQQNGGAPLSGDLDRSAPPLQTGPPMQRGGPPMGPMGPVPPNFRGMMPPNYMYGRGPYPPGGYPPGGYPGMPKPYYQDGRYRGPVPQMPPRHGEDGEGNRRPAIIKDSDLKDFDEITRNDEGWAGVHGEVDYTEKLVFSDDEDDHGKRDRGDKKGDKDGDRSRDRGDRGDRDRDRDRDRDDRYDDRGYRGARDEHGMPIPREAWPGPHPMYRGGPPPVGMEGQRWQQRMPFDHRGPYPPYGMPPPHMGQRPPMPGPMPQGRKSGDPEDDEMWRQKQRMQSEKMNNYLERAMKRREEDERRVSEKSSKGDDRGSRKDERDSDSDPQRSRTASESSEKEHRDGNYRDSARFTPPGYRQYQKVMPPRFQKMQDMMRRQQSEGSEGRENREGGSQQNQGPSPQGSPQGPPAPMMRPVWHPYDPRWMNMPPFMRPPMDMQGMPMPQQIRRGRSDSQGNDSYDGERRTPEDPRYYGPPHSQVPFDEMRRGHGHPPPMYFDHRGYPGPDYDRREYDRDYDHSYREYDKEDEKDAKVDVDDVEEKVIPGDRSPRGSEKSDLSNRSRDRWDEDSPRDYDNKPTVVQKDPFEDASESTKDEEPRSERKESKNRDAPPKEESRKESKPQRDRDRDHDNKGRDRKSHDRKDRDRDNHRDNHSRDNHWSDYRHEGKRRGDGHHHAPPPIPAHQSQQNLPPRSNMTSLKRSSSSMNNNSGNTTPQSEKKLDWAKESEKAWKNENKQKSKENFQKDKSKDTNKAEKQHKESEDKENKPEITKDSEKSIEGTPELEKVPERKDTKPETKPDLKDKQDERKKEDRRDRNDRKDDRNRDRTHDGNRDRNHDGNRDRNHDGNRDRNHDGDRPPVKRMRDDDSKKGYDKQRRRGNEFYENDWHGNTSRGRGRGGREFVRGARGRDSYSGGGSSYRGGSSKRGGSSNREFRFEKSPRFRKEQQTGSKSDSKLEKRGDSEVNEVQKSSTVEEFKDLNNRPAADENDAAAVDKKDEHGQETKAKKRDEKKQEKPAAKKSDNVWRNEDNVWKNADKNNVWNKGDDNVWKGVADETKNVWKADEAKGNPWKTGEDVKNNVWKPDEAPKNPWQIDKNDKPKRDDKIQDGSDRHDRNDDFSSAPRRRDDRRGGGGGYRGGRGGSAHMIPRGEPSRRGRGDFRGMRGSSRGGRGRGYFSAPPRGKMPSRPPRMQDGFSHGDDKRDQKENPKNEFNRPERNQPPRFVARGSSVGSSGRGGYSDRGRYSERGRGRGRGGRGGSFSAGRGRGRPPLQKQNSSDMGNEEWETASESSDVLEKRDRDKEDSVRGDKRTSKSFSSQRPNNDKMSRDPKRSSSERGRSKEKSPSTRVNGQHNRPRSTPNNNNKEADVSVYNVNGFVPNDPTAIQNAVNNAKNKAGPKKSTDLTDVSKPLKTEKDRKAEAMSRIDISNIASVVVIDDQPEVSIDDPTFLFDANEGFQEVTSKKTKQTKQKAAQEAEKMKVIEQKKKEVKEKRSTSRLKDNDLLQPAKVKSEKSRYSKLPPRLQKQQKQKDREKEQQKMMMPKIENWDNEMANEIITAVAMASTPPPQQMNGDDTKEYTSSSSVPAPAPMPAVNAWEKPINFASTIVGDKGDQHDSGIDVSEPPNSITSSTRSSPSNEAKVSEEIIKQVNDKIRSDKKEQVSVKDDSPKPQRQPKSNRIEKQTGGNGNNNNNLKSRGVDEKKPDPIQLPASFKDPLGFQKGEDTSEMKLDFTFDAELAKLTEEEKSEPKQDEPVTKNLNDSHDPSGIQSPTSPAAAADLNFKIASVKNVWDCSLPNVFEQGISSSSTSSTETSNSNSMSTAAQNYMSFSTDIDSQMPISSSEKTTSVSVSTLNASSVENLETMEVLHSMSSPAIGSSDIQESSYSVSASDPIIHVNEPISTAGNSGYSVSKPHVSDTSSMNKVKPQQHSSIQSQPQYPTFSMPSMQGGMSSIPSPPVVMQSHNQYNPFIGSSQPLMNQDNTRYSQHTFGGYSAQQQTPIATPNYSQHNLFLTPQQGQEVYGSNQLAAFRNQQYGQTQQNTIMVSSAKSSLMSATINPPNQAAYGMANNGQKSHQSLTYGSNLNSMQPNTQLYVQFDPNQMLGQGQGQAVNVGSQQVIGSHLVQQRPVQNSNSYISQQTYQQTSYYQNQQSAGFQGLQQVTSPTQFSVQGFNQPNLGIQLQPSGQPQGLSITPQTVNKQPMQFREPPPQPTMQKPPSQLRSPPESMTNLYQAIGTPAQNQSSKQHKEAANLTAKAGITVKPQQRFQHQQQQPYGQKIGTQYVGQPMQPADFSGTVIGRPQLVMGNVMGAARAPHPSAAAAQTARYQQTYQQPTVPVMMSQRQQQQPQVQTTPQQNQRSSQQPSANMQSALIKAQQAKQRAELLQTASNFLNPEKVNKDVKSTTNVADDEKISKKASDDKQDEKKKNEES